MSSLNLKSESTSSHPIVVRNSSTDKDILRVTEGAEGNAKLSLSKADGTTTVKFTAGSGNSYITNGNVGIGTDDPSAQLMLEGDARIRLYQTDGSGDYYWDINYTKEGQFAIQQFSKSGSFVFNGFRLDSDGNAILRNDVTVNGGLTVKSIEEMPSGTETCDLRYDEATGTIYFMRD